MHQFARRANAMMNTVYKFGGTSMSDASTIQRVVNIVAEMGPRFVVVSAPAGVTDALYDLTQRAEAGESPVARPLRVRMRKLAQELLVDAAARDFDNALDQDLRTILSILTAGRVSRSMAPAAGDLVVGFGEVWSARLLAASLGAQEFDAHMVDAREFIYLRHGELGPVVNWSRSQEAFDRLQWRDINVITGFVATIEDGVQTTLGRNGSDFSASIVGRLAKADSIEIWTDVDGVMSADPTRVPDAHVMERLSFAEAMELAYFGAKVVHPQTMGPAVEANIPLIIRNTFAPDGAGTRIGPSREGAGVKGVTCIEDIALLTLEGRGLIGVPGTAARMFEALRVAGISVNLISQGSSEHSICCAVASSRASTAGDAVRQAFAAEIEAGQVDKVRLDDSLSIIAVVGEGMAGAPGIAGRLFSTLGNAGINVHAIAQGASERNISAVVASDDTERALRAVHAGFYLSPRTLSIGVIGRGHVGTALLAQLEAARDRLRETEQIDLRVRGACNSTEMTLFTRYARDEGQAQTKNLDLRDFVDHIHADHLPHAVLVDCTASDEMADHYPTWLGQGIHLVTPNKKAGSGPAVRQRWIDSACRRGKSRLLQETTVGAGLPILGTLKDLVDTGDEIISIEGMLSGTLTYLFASLEAAVPDDGPATDTESDAGEKETPAPRFSDIVRQAWEQGYTEPDPRDDLSGEDVARKLVLLARTAGLDLELAEVEVHGLVPPNFSGLSMENFWQRLPTLDEPLAARLNNASQAGEVLRFVGRIDEKGAASAALTTLPANHAFAQTRPTDNVVIFTTRRYHDNPLVVRGPGAGPEVTAAGVFADILRLAHLLGS